MLNQRPRIFFAEQFRIIVGQGADELQMEVIHHTGALREKCSVELAAGIFDLLPRPFDFGLSNLDDDTGEFGYPKWTGRATFTASMDNLTFTWQTRYIGPVEEADEDIEPLSDAFGYGPELVRAKIASGAEAERQAEARAYYAERRAAGTLPEQEKSPKKR